jgi:threonylcarbamoyladenosine tRNA methylthiotransferase MtaB
MSGVEVITFGCRLNAFESEIVRRNAEAAASGEVVVVNTCAVTTEAERQARQTIRRLRRERPGARIVVTGCAAQIAPERYAAMPEVDRVLGNAEKLDPASYTEAAPRALVGDIMQVRETAPHLVDGFEGRVRAFLEVQTGCDHRCTFCIIPYGRGNSRSVPLGAVVEQARRLVEAGYREVVLTGVDLTSFGADLPGQPSLGQLTRRLLAAVPEIERLRLSSIDVAEIDSDLLDLIAGEPRLMPHLHLSLQAGDEMVLKRMKRRHTPAQAVAFCERVRALRPDVVFGADLIAGFPTEDEAMFARTLEHVEACGLTWLHVFPFSPRPGTPAARMPQVPAALRKERAARLRAAGAARVARWSASQVGRAARVLVEDQTGGRSEHYAPVRLVNPAPVGAIVEATVTAAAATHLLAA